MVVIDAIPDKKNIIFTVKDNGVGIPKKDIDKLFKIDVKYTNPGTSNEKGTGLGLLLCKEFIEKHGGSIWVESTEGKGSEFKFSIPKNIKIEKVAKKEEINMEKL
jgi:signal transduction histidine kinase